MSKSLLLLTLVAAQLLAGSGGAVYLCPDCGSLFAEQAELDASPACSCCHPHKSSPNVELAGWTKSEPHSPIPLLAPQSPSRLRDGEFALRFEHTSAAPLHLSAAQICDAAGLSRPREVFTSAADASQLAALATVCLRC